MEFSIPSIYSDSLSKMWLYLYERRGVHFNIRTFWTRPIDRHSASLAIDFLLPYPPVFQLEISKINIQSTYLLRDSYHASTSKPLVSKVIFNRTFFQHSYPTVSSILIDDSGSPPVWHLNCRQDTYSIGFPLNSSNEWISRSFPLYIRHRTYLKTRSRPIFNNP